MQLIASHSYPIIDEQTLGEYVARDSLFRSDDGSFFLYMAAAGQTEGEERILLLNSRDALLWLNEKPDTFGSYWHIAASTNQSYGSAIASFFSKVTADDRAGSSRPGH
jgi:hypothetical protein